MEDYNKLNEKLEKISRDLSDLAKSAKNKYNMTDMETKRYMMKKVFITSLIIAGLIMAIKKMMRKYKNEDWE